VVLEFAGQLVAMGRGGNDLNSNAAGGYCGNEDIFTDEGCSFGLLAGQIHPAVKWNK